MELSELRKSKNIAELLDDDELSKISRIVIDGYECDELSRKEWKDVNERALDLAKQTLESKSFPWPNASNVKFPLITKASIDFAARTYPELVRNGRIVKAHIIGEDPRGVKAIKAANVSNYMSYLLLNKMDGWEEGLDSSLHMLSIVGTVFKKTYYDPIKKVPVSELCNPDKVVVNHNIKSLKDARRITHLMHVYQNDIRQQVILGNYLDIDVNELLNVGDVDADDDPQIILLEQHTYLDLDEDGYKEPYVVILHKDSEKVLSIKPRFADVKMKDGKVLAIEPDHVFTDYHFIRNHDGGFYSLGFGVLLYPINSTINTLINQLIDAGTLNNLQSGFVGKGIRIKNGDVRPRMGEFKVLDAASGVDLQKNIFLIPTKEPSNVLFQVLGLLIQAGKELTSASEVTAGQAPPSNVPAAAYLNAVDQSLKILNAINKRTHKSFGLELKKIYKLVGKHLTDDEYQAVLDTENAIVKFDFDDVSYDICPVSDPALSSMEQRLAKVQAIMSAPIKNRDAATIMFLEALEVEPHQIQALMTPPADAGPPPEALKLMSEAELNKARIQEITQKLPLTAQELLLKARQLDINEKQVDGQNDYTAALIVKAQHDILNQKEKVAVTINKEEHKQVMKEIDVAHKIKDSKEQNELDTTKIVLSHQEKMADLAVKAREGQNDRAHDLLKTKVERKDNESRD